MMIISEGEPANVILVVVLFEVQYCMASVTVPLTQLPSQLL